MIFSNVFMQPVNGKQILTSLHACPFPVILYWKYFWWLLARRSQAQSTNQLCSFLFSNTVENSALRYHSLVSDDHGSQ